MLQILILLALLALPGAAASDSEMDRATLRGVPAMKVVVDPLQAELQKEGFTINELGTQVRQRLEKAGIKLDPEAKEFLGLTVKCMRTGKRAPFTLMLDLAFYQVVGLSRNQNVKTVAATWSVQDAMLVQPKLLNQITRTAVDNLVDQFVNAYQTENRK